MKCQGKSGKSQGILKLRISGNPAAIYRLEEGSEGSILKEF